MKLIVPLLLAGALLGAVASVPAAAEHNKHDNNNKQGKHEGRNNHQDRNQHEGRNRHDGGNQHEGRNGHDGGKNQNAKRNHNQNAGVNRHNRNDRFTTKTKITVSGFGSRPRNWNRYPDFYAGNWHRNRHADRRFHWNVYVRPHGWYSHRWAYGERLPVSFWAANYWLNDYWMFDLQIPPRGHVWVRTGDDAILINRRSGEIVEVVYDVFY